MSVGDAAPTNGTKSITDINALYTGAASSLYRAFFISGDKMIKIDSYFESLIPPLSEDERKELETSILSEGCRDALVLWGEILIDGHNRYKICTKHGIEFKTIHRDFENREKAEEWIIRNQFGRRNITPFVRSELALRLKDVLSAQARKRQSEAGGDKRSEEAKKLSEKTLVANLPQAKNDKTRDEIAKVAGVSPRTITNVETIKREAPEPIIQATRNNDISINMAHEFTKMPEEEKTEIVERIEQGEKPKEVIKEVKNRPHVTNNSGNNEWYTPSEYIEAARECMGSIDTDPASNDIAQKVVKAETYYTTETNGLEHEWNGNVWMNPPYSSDLIYQFIEKLKTEKGNYNQAIVLVNNATETKWFHELVSLSSCVCFPKARIKFYMPDGKTGAPLQGQAILYIGENKEKFEECFEGFGWTARITEA